MSVVASEGPFAGWEWETPEGLTLGLSVGRVPGRKSVALYATRGTESRILAYFVDESRATLAITALQTMVAGRYE